MKVFRPYVETGATYELSQIDSCDVVCRRRRRHKENAATWQFLTAHGTIPNTILDVQHSSSRLVRCHYKRKRMLARLFERGHTCVCSPSFKNGWYLSSNNRSVSKIVISAPILINFGSKIVKWPLPIISCHSATQISTLSAYYFFRPESSAELLGYWFSATKS